MFLSMLKRDASLFLRCVIPAAVLTAIFALVCAVAALTAAEGAEDVYHPLKVAVVDGEDTLVSRMLISAVGNMDYISGLMEAEPFGMDAAQNAMQRGEIAAIIALPENFSGDISAGKLSRGQIILSPAAASNSRIVETAARFGELLLAAGQYGVFSGEELILENGLDAEVHNAYLAYANSALLSEGIGAGEHYFNIVLTDYEESGMGTLSYYAMNWLTFLLFICAICFTALYRTDLNRSMLCRLRAVGIKDGTFLFGKVLYPALFRVLLLAAAAAVLAPLVSLQINLRSAVGAVLSAVLAGIFATALGLCLRSGAAATALVAIVGIVICGGVIPIRMLPDALLDVGALSPFGVVRNCLAPLFGGRFSAAGAAMAAVYTLAALLWMAHSLRRLRAGGEQA